MARLADRRADGRFPPARKRFGQHFLEAAWVTKLVDAVRPHPDDTFLEIGPGRGALTRALAPRVGRILAVEIDRDLAASLEAEGVPNLQVVTADVLEVDLGALLESERLPARAIGNLPYNVASPILFRLLDAADEGRRLTDATVMLQKEVADRLAARPGDDAYGALAIQAALLTDVERLLTLPPGAFRPPPKVMSAVVRLTFRPPVVDVGDRATFEKVVRGVFLQRRKTLVNAFRPVAEAFGRSAAEVIDQAALNPRARPETLTVEEFGRLCRAVL